MTGLNKIKVSDFVEQINQAGSPILVEGVNDKKALLQIGVTNQVFTLSRRPLYKVAEQLSSYKEIIFLFDNDRAGRELSAKMNVELSRLGVKVDKHFQILLGKMHFSHVEGIK